MKRVQNTPAWKKVLVNLLAVVMLFSLVITVPTVANAAATPTISKKSQNILVDEEYDFNIKNKVKGSTYTWKSSNKKVATVDKKGIVTGIKKGTATITCEVKAPNKTYKLTAKVAIKEPAVKFVINNKVEALNLGQKYDLNRTLSPKSSNDLTTWTTTDKTIANPNSKGVFTALKEGKVTITGKTLSGETDKVTIDVVDKAGTVTTQEELDKLLGSGVALITIKTDESVSLSIKKGDYTNQTLVVDAPKADVVNDGQFKSIEIKRIKANTWTENGKGNKITVSTFTGRIVVGKDANVSIEVAKENSAIAIENNGTVQELVIKVKAEVTIDGTSKTAIPVTVSGKDARVISNIPLVVTAEAKIVLILGAGATGTEVHVASKDLMPVVQGEGKITVVIGEGNSATKEEVDAEQPAAGGGGGTYFPPVEDKTEIVKRDTNGNYMLTKGTYKNIESVVARIKVGDLSNDFTFDQYVISKLISFLDDPNETVNRWEAIDTEIKTTISGFEVTVSSTTQGSLTKKVTFPNASGLPEFVRGRAFEVTVNPSDNSVSIGISGGAMTHTLKKVGDTTLKIDGSLAAAIELVITFK